MIPQYQQGMLTEKNVFSVEMIFVFKRVWF